MNWKNLLSLIVLALGLQLSLAAQEGSSIDRIFLLGEAEQEYEQYTSMYSQSMLEAAELDIAKAFEAWLGMMQEIDRYAAQIDYDIKGVKVILHVFWNESGKIDRMGFLLRDDSRLVDAQELRAFFAGFAKDYQFPIKSSRKFNHYTSATFPTLSEKANN